MLFYTYGCYSSFVLIILNKGCAKLNLDLWGKELDFYYKGEINLEVLEQVQNELKQDLPKSYIDLMTQRNGFYLKKQYHPTTTPNSWANNSVHIGFLYGIGENPGLLDNGYLRKEWGIRSKKLIIISDEPPTFICLDYRKRKNPSVVFIDVDQNQEIQLANNFDEFINGLVEKVEEDDVIPYMDALSEQQIKNYYAKIDNVIAKGKPKEIDRLLTEVLSTNTELIRYLVEKMRHHEVSKVQFYLMLFLIECAEGNNKGIIEDDYLAVILKEISTSKNKDAKHLALYSLDRLSKRLNV